MMAEEKMEETKPPLARTGRFDHLRKTTSVLESRTNVQQEIEDVKEPEELEELEELGIAKEGSFDSKVRTLVIQVNPDATVEVKSDDLFIAREMTKIEKSIKRWYRERRRNYLMQQHQKQAKE